MSDLRSDIGEGVVLVLGCAALTLILFSLVFAIPIIIVVGCLFIAYKYYTKSPAALERKARQETYLLYEKARAITPAIPTKEEFGRELLDHIPTNIPDALISTALEVALDLYDLEFPHGSLLEAPPPICNSVEGARYRDRLLRHLSQTHRTDTIRHFRDAIADSLHATLSEAPEEASEPAIATVPLRDLIGDPRPIIERIIYPYYAEEIGERELFTGLKKTLNRNLEATGKNVVYPADYTGVDAVSTYLVGTPFVKLFEAPIPFSIPERVRFEHHVIVGGTGQGKTVTLKRLIRNDLEAPSAPSIVVIDSQTALIADISRLRAIQDRNPIIIDPRDSVGLNVFDINQRRLSRYDEHQRDQVYNHTLEVFHYLFSSLLGADLTVKQASLFNNLVALMLKLPATLGRNATLLDLINATDDLGPYGAAIGALEPIAREFFTKDFRHSQYNETKAQIRYRLQTVLSNKVLARLFLAPENTIDFHEAINRGSVVLVDTSKAYLGATNSSYLGRICLTLILNAVLERAANPSRTGVFIYVDEAGEYFDRSIDTFLTEARKHKAGIILAHQNLNQMDPNLRASVASNTGIKFAGGVSSQDARSLAVDMRTMPEFILNQPKLSFAAYIRHHTKSAVSLNFRDALNDDAERLDDEEYRAFRAENRRRYSRAEVVDHGAPGEEPHDPFNIDL